MPRVITTSTTVNASPEAVWRVLTTFREYPEWNPYYREVQGRLAVGEQLTMVASLAAGSRPVTARPRVLEVREGRSVSWTNRFGLPGILDSRQVFELVTRDASTTELRQTETFSGLLLPLMTSTLDRIDSRLRETVDALKVRAESGGGATAAPGA